MDLSGVLLVFLTGSIDPRTGQQYSDYFASTNCKREFKHAVAKSIPIVLVEETDMKHGSVDLSVHREACPAELRPAFDHACPAVPWYRVPDFQVLSLRLILQAVINQGVKQPIDLAAKSDKLDAREIYIRGELMYTGMWLAPGTTTRC